MNNIKPLKRIVIKEELVALTGDYKKAILLNQFIYWSERVYDFDKFIAEERERCVKSDIEYNLELQNGWIYKTADALADETMLNMHKSNIVKHVDELIAKGWLDVRNNPNHKWDRTRQYRVNIVKIQYDLFEMGYSLEGYPLIVTNDYNASCKTQHAENQVQNGLDNFEQNFEQVSHEKDVNNVSQPRSCKTQLQSERNKTAIPEITTENNNIYNNLSIYLSDKRNNNDLTYGLKTYEEYKNLIKRNINYSTIKQRLSEWKMEEIDGMIDIITEIVTSKKEYIRVAGKELPAEIVKSRFLKLEYKHIEYVLECLKETTTDIKNIKSYTITSLYNAPATIKNYYMAKINEIFDMEN